jgi:parallel beta-helix repeat protein
LIKSKIALGMLLAAGMLVGCSLLRGLTRPISINAVLFAPCIDSGDQSTINAQLEGPGDAAILCPGALFQLTGPVVFTAARQQIYTKGSPTGDMRARLLIVSPTLASAVTMRDYDAAVLSNVIVDGNRANLGPTGGEALIYAGGTSDGQVIRGNKIKDPRSWSALQLIQGYSDSQPCTNALVENNEIGPAGTSDNLLWADGISFTCTNSIVRNNVITDATDGGIVVFGAPGSLIEGNTVRAQTRTLLGGINMVDEGAYGGRYTGTIVRNNVIDASGAVIRIGLGMGPRVWVCLPPNETGHTISGGTVTGNTLRGTHMQYGFAVDGVRGWTVTGNVDEATHAGTPSFACGSLVASAPSGFLYNSARSDGTFQPEFRSAQLDLALWAIVAPRPGE